MGPGSSLSTSFFTSLLGLLADEDECVRSPCDSTQRCVNSVGSYTCECRDGFTRDSTTLACVGERQRASAFLSIASMSSRVSDPSAGTVLFPEDVNECQLGTAACLHTQRCDNTIGSYQCIRHSGCGTGYTLNAATGSCEGEYLRPSDAGSGVALSGSDACHREPGATNS